MDYSREIFAPNTSLNLSDFDLDAFLAEHTEDFVVIVSGSCTPQTESGSYAYRTWHDGKKTPLRKQSLTGVTSPTNARLEAVLAACTRIQSQNGRIFVLTNSLLNLDYFSSYGANSPLKQSIADVCNEKHLELSTLTIAGSKDLIHKALELNG